MAASKGRLDVVKYLVEKGTDIHAEDEGALRWAAYNGHIDVVEFLLEKGCPVDVANRIGGDAVKDFCKVYELRKMLDAKLQQSTPTKTKTAKLKI
ncbi:Ankyrin repeat protein [compost metagenome]